MISLPAQEQVTALTTQVTELSESLNVLQGLVLRLQSRVQELEAENNSLRHSQAMQEHAVGGGEGARRVCC